MAPRRGAKRGPRARSRSCARKSIARSPCSAAATSRRSRATISSRHSRKGTGMAEGIKPIRRVVTGNDSNGRSRVLYDSAAPRVKASAFKKGTGMTDIWMFDSSPAPLSGDRDDGDLPFHFEPPEDGGRLRIVQSDSRPDVYDASKDEHITPEHPPKKTEGGTWERGRQNLYRTRIHKSE